MVCDGKGYQHAQQGLIPAQEKAGPTCRGRMAATYASSQLAPAASLPLLLAPPPLLPGWPAAACDRVTRLLTEGASACARLLGTITHLIGQGSSPRRDLQTLRPRHCDPVLLNANSLPEPSSCCL